MLVFYFCNIYVWLISSHLKQKFGGNNSSIEEKLKGKVRMLNYFLKELYVTSKLSVCLSYILFITFCEVKKKTNPENQMMQGRWRESETIWSFLPLMHEHCLCCRKMKR